MGRERRGDEEGKENGVKRSKRRKQSAGDTAHQHHPYDMSYLMRLLTVSYCQLPAICNRLLQKEISGLSMSPEYIPLF